MKQAEWPMIILTAIIALSTAANVVVYWCESESAGKQTDKLIAQANIQANAATKMSAAARDQVDAANNFADSAEGINISTDAAVTEFSRLAKSTEDSVKTAQGASRLDQRAWVYAFPKGELSYSDVEPVLVPYMLINSGKTLARNVDGFVRVQILARNTSPTFKYGDEVPGPPSFHFGLGALFPNAPINLKPLYWISPIYGVIDPNNPDPAPLQPGDTEAINIGKKYIVTHGKFTYEDAFGIQHWVQFCTATHGNRFTGKGVKECAEYNNADKTQEER
jgi:hypothetical protein